jgi:hypothetical protein
MVREFGVGIYQLPAEKVQMFRRILIAEAENTPQAKARARSPEAELEALERKSRRAKR